MKLHGISHKNMACRGMDGSSTHSASPKKSDARWQCPERWPYQGRVPANSSTTSGSLKIEDCTTNPWFLLWGHQFFFMFFFRSMSSQSLGPSDLVNRGGKTRVDITFMGIQGNNACRWGESLLLGVWCILCMYVYIYI